MTLTKQITYILLIVIFCISGPLASRADGQSIYTNYAYLPIAQTTPPKTTFGVEINPSIFASITQKVVDSGIYWVRFNGLLWSQVQPDNSSEWNWQNIATLDQNLAQAASIGARVVLVIRSTPIWAQQIPGKYCGPMTPNKISAFADFVNQAVKRYSAPPYNVNYYEIWNEPDVGTSISADSAFGCWGNYNDANFGGGYYADMLKQVYPALRSASQNAQLLIGGLLLDCDPTSTTGGCTNNNYRLPPRFFEGILKNGGGAFFDIVNFHGYTQYTQVGNPIYFEQSFPSWSNRGGVVEGKISYLRELMATYGIHKPIFQSEAALLLRSTTVEASFEQAKSDYVAWLYTRNTAEGILGTTWFTLDGPGWYDSGLLDANQASLPSHQALKFATNELIGANFDTRLNSFPGIEGFQFSKGSRKVWVIFSQDNYSHTLTVPGPILAAYDVLGSPVTTVNQTLTTYHPIYIEFSP